MRRYKFSRWLVLTMAWLVACGGNGHQAPVSLPTETTPVCPEAECIQEQATHEIAASSTATTTVTPCAADRQLYAQKPVGLPGTLVYRFIRDADTIHLIGGHPLRQHSLEVNDQDAFRLVGFSPSGDWLAYLTGAPYESIPQTIHLLSSSGEVVQTTPIELVPTEAGTFKGTWGSVLWVNDKTMLIYIAHPHPEYPDASPLMIKALLNPFTGEWQPNYLEGMERKQTGMVSFAPDMTRVLFYSEAEGHLPEIRLWDREREVILWSQEDIQDTLLTSDSKIWTGSAAWSPDSNWVAFTAVESRNEDDRSLGVGVYLLDREGSAGRIITDFHVRYGPPFTAGTLSWSPDGRYLAMSVSIAGSDSDSSDVQEDRFYLYDLKNDDLLDLCWSREIHSGYNSTMRTLVWSPDSRYIAYVANVSVLEDGQRLPRTLILVDIYTGEVMELVENAVLLGGWSAFFTP
ncbi:MAG TPA: hypothetical protein PLD25_30330 [Chloroflexota bacterium]|nr:hypothetical protein [Chloroflexota bacterium]HUM67571.1 hypothetical protein [Chloroflexota bacterium]